MVTTEDMLKVLQFSKNELTAKHASIILLGIVSKKQAMEYGGFMQAVLNSNYELALQLADSDNLKCLHRIPD